MGRKTLPKWARALEIPPYELFYEEKKPAKLANLAKRVRADEVPRGVAAKGARMLEKFRQLLNPMEEADRPFVAPHGAEDGSPLAASLRFHTTQQNLDFVNLKPTPDPDLQPQPRINPVTLQPSFAHIFPLLLNNLTPPSEEE